jgi:hypothetical protein
MTESAYYQGDDSAALREDRITLQALVRENKRLKARKAPRPQRDLKFENFVLRGRIRTIRQLLTPFVLETEEGGNIYTLCLSARKLAKRLREAGLYE